MNVTLHSLKAGVYEVCRDPSGFTPRVVVLASSAGWDVLQAGVGVGGFPSSGAVRDWLDGAGGQRWLDHCEKSAATRGGAA